jgi:hypothetical protein
MHFQAFRRVALTMAVVASALPAAAPALASTDSDVVVEWNLNASNAIVGVARQAPHAAIFSFAMVQGAVYDAVNAIAGGHQPYLGEPAAAGDESIDAAVAAAAYGVLRALFPSQEAALTVLYDQSLADVPDGDAETAGVAVGSAAAAAMLSARTGDGRGAAFTAVIGFNDGEWRPTTGTVTDPVGWAGNVKPFLMSSPEQFRSDGPNSLSSVAYARDFNEVKAVGSLTSTTRTADQTDAVLFWNDNGVALWNRIQRSLASNLSAVDAARLFAMTNLAGADGVIACWNDKNYWKFWRPITAIQNAANDGNSATAADPDWKPLLTTPPFPDHPSGHSCVSGAIVTTMQNFFGTDKVAFSGFSNNSGTTRSFDRLSHALKEIIGCRVWAGIHFRTADVQGSVIGKKVAHLLNANYFAPTD